MILLGVDEKQMVPEKKEDDMESHFKTSMMFQKSMKAL